MALVIVALLAAGLLSWYWHKHHTTNKLTNGPESSSGVSPAPPTKNAKRSSSSPSSTINQGGANDQNGQVPAGASGNTSQWATSPSGLITLKSPLKDGLFKNGDAIYGSASSGPVQFRLIDNNVGVIAQGPINVVNGSFSATASFKSYASTGRLDVFNTDSNGKEINEVQVPVTFE